jgi:nitrate reductase cytochrome c-type subunit
MDRIAKNSDVLKQDADAYDAVNVDISENTRLLSRFIEQQKKIPHHSEFVTLSDNTTKCNIGSHWSTLTRSKKQSPARFASIKYLIDKHPTVVLSYFKASKKWIVNEDNTVTRNEANVVAKQKNSDVLKQDADAYDAVNVDINENTRLLSRFIEQQKKMPHNSEFVTLSDNTTKCNIGDHWKRLTSGKKQQYTARFASINYLIEKHPTVVLPYFKASKKWIVNEDNTLVAAATAKRPPSSSSLSPCTASKKAKITK